MRTLFGTCGCVVASAALTLACGGSGGASIRWDRLRSRPPRRQWFLSGSWRGTLNQSGDTRGYPSGAYRNGTVRLSLTQSGTQVKGTGNTDGANRCMPSSFLVTGTVSGASFSLHLTNSGRVGTIDAYGVVDTYGVVAGGGELDAQLSSSRAECQEWGGNSSLNRER